MLDHLLNFKLLVEITNCFNDVVITARKEGIYPQITFNDMHRKLMLSYLNSYFEMTYSDILYICKSKAPGNKQYQYRQTMNCNNKFKEENQKGQNKQIKMGSF